MNTFEKSKNSLLIMVPNSKRQKCRKKTSELDIDWDDHFRVSLKTEIISFSNHLFFHNNDIIMWRMNLIRKNVTPTFLCHRKWKNQLPVLNSNPRYRWISVMGNKSDIVLFKVGFHNENCSLVNSRAKHFNWLPAASLWKPLKYTETEKFYWADTK